MNEYIGKEMILDVIKARGRYLGDAEIMNSMDKTALDQIEGYEMALDSIAEDINNIPPANVQPVKRGKWIETHISLCKWIPEDEKEEGHSFYMAEMKCSCCKRYNTATFVLTLDKPDFCQLCGARMDDDKKECAKDDDFFDGEIGVKNHD